MQKRTDTLDFRIDAIEAGSGRFIGRATLAKEGVYTYVDGDRTWREFVPMATLTNAAWLDSLRMAPVTLNHPVRPLTRDNARQYAVGSIGETVVRLQDMIGSSITIWDGTAIDAAMTTHREVSLGYECDLDPTPGTWHGIAYDSVQVARRANHVALVDRGRHGPDVRVQSDAADLDDAADELRADEESFTPPASVAAAARRGLAIREKEPPSNRGGTEVGLARARQLANRQPVSLSTIKRMVSYFARHGVDKTGEGWGKNSKGWQAWLLWGGDAGKRWAEGILRRQSTDHVDMAVGAGPAWLTVAHNAQRIDASEDCMAALMIGTLKLDVDSASAAAATAHLDALNTKATEAAARADRAEAELDAAKAALETAKAEHTKALETVKADAVATAKARVQLETLATAVCGRKYDCADKSDRQVRVDMLAKLGVTVGDDRSDDYIVARLDAALELAAKQHSAASVIAGAMNADGMRKGSADEDMDDDDDDDDMYDKKGKDKKGKKDAAPSANELLRSRWG
jgi:hypothetical protein